MVETDENVFDIKQGVCILLCVKERDNPVPAKVYYADLVGTSGGEIQGASRRPMSRPMSGQNFQPLTSPYYLFCATSRGRTARAEYEVGWKKITDIFQTSSIGIITARDKLTIHWTAEAVTPNGN